jgi:uncharacterized repeat protein (TIGR03987 family)
MSSLLMISIPSMILALVMYSIGVWSEKGAGRLRPWHMAFFWIGLVFDLTGTTLMGVIAGKMDLDFHGITGALAIILMSGHALWATVVLVFKQEKAIRYFHRFSLAVWSLWLIPFVSGMLGAMIHI